MTLVRGTVSLHISYANTLFWRLRARGGVWGRVGGSNGLESGSGSGINILLWTTGSLTTPFCVPFREWSRHSRTWILHTSHQQ